MKQADRITNDIIHRMVHDSRKGEQLFNYSLNTANSIQVNMAIHRGDVGYSGFIVNFTIRPAWQVCLDEIPFNS